MFFSALHKTYDVSNILRKGYVTCTTSLNPFRVPSLTQTTKKASVKYIRGHCSNSRSKQTGKYYFGWGQGSQPLNKHEPIAVLGTIHWSDRSHMHLPSLTRQKFTWGNITSLMNCLQPPHGEMKRSFMSLQRSKQTTVCEGTSQLCPLSGVCCGKNEIVTEVWFRKGIYLTKLSERKCTSKNTAFGESYSHRLSHPI